MDYLYKNIKLSEALKDEEVFSYYVNMAKYLNPKNVMNLQPLQKMAWGFIKEIQYNLTKGNYENEDYIELLKKITGTDVLKIGVIDFFYQLQWIVDELKKLTEKEKYYLSSELTPEQIEAGYEDLNKFGYKTTTHALAGNDILKHEAVEALPYEQVFSVLLMEKTIKEIEINLMKQKR